VDDIEMVSRVGGLLALLKIVECNVYSMDMVEYTSLPYPHVAWLLRRLKDEGGI
jgi:hypothetical protein